MILCPHCKAIGTIETIRLNEGYLAFCSVCGYEMEELLPMPLLEIIIVEVARVRESKDE